LRRCSLDSRVDFDPIRHHRGDDPAGERAGRGVRLDLGQVTLEDRRRGPLPEVGLEHRGQRDAPPGPQGPDAV
jgi:hypothetical protein